MFFSNYYKVESDDSFFAIYVMDNPSTGAHIEIHVDNYKLKDKPNLYRITDALHNLSQPYLFRNLLFKNGEENYKKISKDEFLTIFDEATMQHRHNCL